MTRRGTIALGMALGGVWALGTVFLPLAAPQVFLPLNVALILAFAPGGLFLMLVIGRIAQRRFFDDEIIDGQPLPWGSPAEIDQRVLTNTVEQMVLALALWPFVAMVLGGQVVVVMGLAFAVARAAFWIGYHRAPPLRAFGFAASFYPTILGTLWAVAVWFV